MGRIPAKQLLAALQAKAGAVKLTGEGDDPLFEHVELFSNKKLGDALSKLVLTKSRVLLIVPTGIRRTHQLEVNGEVTHLFRYLQVDLLIADRAYYKAEQVALVGGDKNAGVIELFERLEQELDGAELSPYGPVIWQDGASDTVTSKDVPEGRVAWFQSLLIPAGDNS